MNRPEFKTAIVRPPGANFADGLTTAGLGAPDYALAIQQHAAYCRALRACGLELAALEPDQSFPDGTFVEDVAVLTSSQAILTNPGAESRKGEVDLISAVLARYYPAVHRITPPGILDGGDVCDAGGRFFIGLSERTNLEGARQLAGFLAQEGCTASFIPVWGIPGILHLKSGIASLGEKNLVAVDAFADHPDFAGYHVVRVPPQETYAANCIRVNDWVLIPQGYPRLQKAVQDLGYAVIPLAMTEFEKMDGGLSCLSLRF